MKTGTRKVLVLTVLLLIPLVIIGMMFIKENDIELDFGMVKNISFSQLESFEDIQALNGKKVRVLGYISPSSPYGTSFIYLSNKPYDADVFAEDTYEEFAVYSKGGKIISYSNYPVYVEGKLVLGDFEDKQGYVYEYRIENAEIVNATLEQVDGLVKKYLVLAQDDVLNELNGILADIDMFIYYDEYKPMGQVSEETLSKIDIDAIDTLTQKIQGYNEETYNTIIEVLGSLKDIANELNILLEEKKYDNFADLKQSFEDAYYEFYYYMAEFEV